MFQSFNLLHTKSQTFRGLLFWKSEKHLLNTRQEEKKVFLTTCQVEFKNLNTTISNSFAKCHLWILTRRKCVIGRMRRIDERVSQVHWTGSSWTKQLRLGFTVFLLRWTSTWWNVFNVGLLCTNGWRTSTRLSRIVCKCFKLWRSGIRVLFFFM